jgi:hypothetical protein
VTAVNNNANSKKDAVTASIPKGHERRSPKKSATTANKASRLGDAPFGPII